MLSYQEQLQKIVIPQIKKEFGLKNNNSVPKINKVIINTGIGRLLSSDNQNKEVTLKKVINAISLITGQKPKINKTKKSIASFKLREGMVVGLKSTLRKKRMNDFITKFVHLSLPRTRDFWGISLNNIDQNGNLNYGVKDHIIFPEINLENEVRSLGLEITFVTNAKKREQAVRLFELLGFPFQKKN